MAETELVYYTHHDLQYVTVHNYRAQGTFRYEQPQGRAYAALVFVESGCVQCEQHGAQPVKAAAGDWIYLPEGCRYTSQWTGEAISYFTLDFRIVRRLIMQHVPHVSVMELGAVQPTAEICVLAHGDPVMKHELEQICRCFADEKQNILATAAFYRLWYHVTCIFERRTSDDEIARAVAYIEDHLLQPLQLEQLCRLCCMGKSTFFKRFRAATGTSPVQYRNRLLVQMGRELLSGGTYSIAQVSVMLGLCSPDYFTVLCRKEDRKLQKGTEKTTQIQQMEEIVLAENER